MTQQLDPPSVHHADWLGRDLPPDPRALAAVTLAEFEAIARERLHRIAFDSVAGGAWEEIGLAEAEAAWQRCRFRPRVLVDVAAVTRAHLAP